MGELNSKEVLLVPYFFWKKQGFMYIVGSLSTDGEIYKNITIKKWIWAALNFIALYPSHLICLMLANLFEVEFLRTVSKFWKRTVFPSSTNHEIRHFHVVVAAKKCTKECDACAKSLFCQFKPIAFLLFSLKLPSLLLKFPICWRKSPAPCPQWQPWKHAYFFHYQY